MDGIDDGIPRTKERLLEHWWNVLAVAENPRVKHGQITATGAPETARSITLDVDDTAKNVIGPSINEPHSIEFLPRYHPIHRRLDFHSCLTEPSSIRSGSRYRPGYTLANTAHTAHLPLSDLEVS